MYNKIALLSICSLMVVRVSILPSVSFNFRFQKGYLCPLWITKGPSREPSPRNIIVILGFRTSLSDTASTFKRLRDVMLKHVCYINHLDNSKIKGKTINILNALLVKVF